MQYAVPQFVEVEDKVIGPLTVKQFLYMLGGGALSFMAYKTCDMELFILLTIVFMGGATAIAFVKIQGIPILTFIINVFRFFTRPKVMFWVHDPKLTPLKATDKYKREMPKEEVPERIPVTKSRLMRLACDLDTYGVATEAREVEEKEEKE